MTKMLKTQMTAQDGIEKNKKKKKKRGRNKPASDRSQQAWRSGRQDINLDDIDSLPLRNQVHNKKRLQPHLTRIQIVNNIYQAQGEFNSVARKLLNARKIKPWAINTQAVKPSKSGPRTSNDVYWKTLTRGAKKQYISKILQMTRLSRAPISISDLLSWCDTLSPKAASKAQNFITHMRNVVDTTVQYSCEDALVATMNSGRDFYTIARRFLFHAVKTRADIQVDTSDLDSLIGESAERSLSEQEEDADDEIDDEVTDDEVSVDEDDEDDKENNSFMQDDANSLVDPTRDDDGHEMSYEPEPATLPSDGRSKDGEPNSRSPTWTSVNAPVKQSATVAEPPPALSSSVPLWQLSPVLQELQRRYFGIKHPTDIVFCTTCGQKGHSPGRCEEAGCSFCGEEHSAAYCSQNHKCARCRQRGHSALRCSRPSMTAGLPGDECDVCGKLGHSEEECGRLWCTFDLSQARKISSTQMRPQCYNCGEQQHWGDDCPYLPRSVQERTVFSSTFSKANAAVFMEQNAWQSGGLHEVQRNGGSLPAYQLRQLDDY